MNIDQIKGFLTVAREKGFSRAARKLYKTQSTMSIQIKALEDELGTKLFDRINPKKTELTKDGTLFLELASSIVQDFDSIIEQFNHKRGIATEGEIKIATHEPVIAHLLPEAIKQFKRKHPDTNILLYRKEREDILSSILNGEVDFGISYLKNVPSSLRYEIIEKNDRILILPRNHPLQGKKNVTLEDIAEYPLILPPPDFSMRKIIDEVFKTNGMKYKLALEVSGREATKKYIELGFGISVFNESFLSKEDRKKFSIKNAVHLFGQSERAIMTRKNKLLPEYMRNFIELIKSSRQIVDV